MSAAPGGRANVRLCPDRSLFRKDIELCPSAPPSRGVRPISGHSPLWASHAKIVDCRSDERDGLTNGREHCRSHHWQNFAKLNPRDKALVAAELFATNDEIDAVELEAAFQRGLDDVKAGRVRPVEKVKEMIPRWTSKS